MSQRSKLFVPPDQPLALKDRATDDTDGFSGKADAEAHMERQLKALKDLQYQLHASASHALLVILQGMDAAGKDGVIRHLAAGLNPQGCEVTSFKAPSDEELQHDFLWRCHARSPRRGRIGIFNRSHYEDVLVVRVHPELALKGRPPGIRKVEDIGAKFWKQRYEQIRAFESMLAASGTQILKFFLHISRDEQRERLLERIDEPGKNWKFDGSDVAERRHWDSYQKAYEHALAATSTEHAPWYVVPADKKWYARTVIADLVVDALRGLDLELPSLDKAARAGLATAREELAADGKS